MKYKHHLGSKNSKITVKIHFLELEMPQNRVQKSENKTFGTCVTTTLDASDIDAHSAKSIVYDFVYFP